MPSNGSLRHDRTGRNLNADILSDLGSALAGSLGLAAGANLNPERRFPSMFEPVHGSAPDTTGQGLANLIGAVGSAALMLEHFGLPDQAARLNKAIEANHGRGHPHPRRRRHRRHGGRHQGHHRCPDHLSRLESPVIARLIRIAPLACSSL
ncbi:isocitrate/isopropylmalate family dehydrogenase [Streptomyces violaceus]